MKKLTSAVFLDVAKTFYTILVDVLHYKLTALNFPSYLLKTISSYMHSRMFDAHFQIAIFTSHLRAGVAQGGTISPILFSLYVNDMPSPYRHVELALYADYTAVIVTSRQPALLVK